MDDARVDPATGQRSRFRSSILPPYARRSPKVAEVLPLLYLHGRSTKDFVPALAEFFGTSSGLSAPAISRLTASWSAEREAFMARDLSEVDYVYCWVDGVHFTVRLGGDDRLCVLVIVGVRSDGTKELVAIADGYRESTESWAELLRGCKARGMRAPVLAGRRRGPGVLGCGPRRVPGDPVATGLGAQGGQRVERPPRLGAGLRASGPAGDLGR